MPTVASWTNLMPWSVTLAPRSSGGSYSGQSYGTAVSYNAAIQVNAGEEVIKTGTGQEVVYKYKIYLQTTTVPDPLDQVTLPSEFGGVTPEIVMVQPVADENGIHHVKLWVK